ncbi:MAG: threonine/serine exporter family protein [Candidatus Fimivivens sp.]
MSILCASLAALGFGIFFNLRGVKLQTAAIGGGIGWLFFLLAESGGDLAQYCIASAAITLYAEVVARIQRAPVTIYLVPALIPLVPGGLIYEAMLHVLNGKNELFLSVGLRALTITGALTIGIVAISSLMRLIYARKLRLHRPMS